MIEVRDAVFRYTGDSAPAVAGVSLDVKPGEVVGIVGPNGSGKSTFARLMKGLLLPSEGHILVDGVDSALDAIGVRRLVGLVFQNPNSQIVNAVVEQEVAFGPENLDLPPTEIRGRVERALGMVGLTGRETAESHSLSMADKQRIALAAVLAMEPRYLILDESTAWLEPAARWTLLGHLLSWAAEQKVGVILVTHRMDEAQFCRRLYGMLHGRIEITGSPDDVLHNPEVRSRLSLALPDAYALTRELHEAGLPVNPGDPLDRVAQVLCGS